MYPQQQQQQQQVYPYNPNYPPKGDYPPAGGFYQQNQGGQPSVNINVGPPTSPNTGSGGGEGGGTWIEPAGLFKEKEIRGAFVSKVYSILTVQLLFTSILIGFFVLHGPTKEYFSSSGKMLVFVGFGIFFVAYIILACIESARRSTPINFILLSFVTLGYGLVAAITSCRYDTTVVFSAFIATGLSCFLIALFAKSTKFDMTNCGTTLCLISLAQFVIGLLLIAILVPTGKAELASIIMSIVGAFVASLYLIFDLQLIMGGRKCELSPEEYILGAIMLYTDVIQIFIYLLEIFARISKD